MIGILLKMLFGDMKDGKVEYRRLFNRSDWTRNRTIIVYSGNLEPHKLSGAIDVLTGKAHARHYPRGEKT